MAANPSKIVVSTSSKADNANNESKALAELDQVKRAQEFEQYKKELIDSRPELSTYKHSEYIYPLSNYFPTVIAKLTIGYLRETEILQLSAIEPPILNVYRSEVYEIMTLRKIVSEKLLPDVTAANPKGIDEFFKNPKGLPKILLTQSGVVHPKILLTKSNYKVGYYSEKLKEKEFVCLAHLKNISSWQAAFLCGDGPFLGLRLLSYIIGNNSLSHQEKDNLLWEARQQLDELIENIAEFLAPLKALIRAYNNYISQYDALAKQGKWDELDKLWGQVGECHKRLPHYILQEFFSPTPFDPIPDFNTEPSRDECRYWNNDLLDLDELGARGFIGLYKGGAGRRVEPCGGRGAVGVGRGAALDLAALTRLCELREEGLKHTFNCLQTLESALTLISNNKNPRIAL